MGSQGWRTLVPCRQRVLQNLTCDNCYARVTAPVQLSQQWANGLRKATELWLPLAMVVVLDSICATAAGGAL